MKTSIKEYSENVETRRQAKNAKENARHAENWDLHNQCEKTIKALETYYFDKLDTVSVSFSIGYRSYYRDVVKIGKTYFTHGDKMTKGNGYRSIEEIEKITDKMQNEMISDMYYY